MLGILGLVYIMTFSAFSSECFGVHPGEPEQPEIQSDNRVNWSIAVLCIQSADPIGYRLHLRTNPPQSWSHDWKFAPCLR